LLLSALASLIFIFLRHTPTPPTYTLSLHDALPITAVINLVVGTMVTWRVINTPGLADQLLDEESARRLVDYEFSQYYFENPAFDFFLHVWVNNARVSANCLLLGILIIPVLVLLWANIENVAVIAGYMIEAGRADIFWGLLLPHGLLE